ncbi:hypothetical protein PRIPAC_88015, partial [Pristionchus pacificus]|uniref:Uncharacterized protein n=1 Tax=Pristionchus pacificus TaxID=54126 RepID=A0A2A6B7R7_PRIPA
KLENIVGHSLTGLLNALRFTRLPCLPSTYPPHLRPPFLSSHFSHLLFSHLPDDNFSTFLSLPHMNSPCPSGVLTAGYTDVYFPFFYYNGLTHRGLSLEIWRVVAKQFNCSSVRLIEYSEYTSQSLLNETGWEFTENGNLAAIKKSDIFVDLTLNSLTSLTIGQFRSTADIVIDQLSLYQADNGTVEEGWTPVEFFLVFSPPILVLIVISSILINLTNNANERLKTTPGLCFRYLVSMLFSLAITTLFFLHAAVFKGNMIVAAKPVLFPWDQMMADLKSGSVQLLESVSNFELDQYEEMLGSNKPIRPGSTIDVVTELCKKKRTSVAALYDTQVLFISDSGSMPKNCRLNRLPPQGNSSLVNESFLPATFVYLLPRNTTKKTVEKINQIIMKMFSYEKVRFAFHSRLLDQQGT